MENSVELAKYMQRYVCQATGRQDMGAQQDNLAVLRLSSMPGCLVELGFISTRDEEQYMNSKAAEEQYARGLFNAFLAYWKKHDKSVNIPFRPEPTPQKVEIPQIVPQNEVPQKEAPKKEVPQEAAPLQPATPQPLMAEPVVSAEPVAPLAQDTLPQSESVQEVPVVVEAQQVPQRQVTQPQAPQPVIESAPVFKVQILASSTKVKAGDARLKGQKADYYQEGGLYKYTVGASEDYYEINRLRKTLATSFPEAFIVAFKDGSRMNVNEAIAVFKNRKVKK